MKTYAESTFKEQAAYRWRRAYFPQWTAEYPADTPLTPNVATVALVPAVRVPCPHCGDVTYIALGDYGNAVEIATYGDRACAMCKRSYELPETLPALET